MFGKMESLFWNKNQSKRFKMDFETFMASKYPEINERSPVDWEWLREFWNTARDCDKVEPDTGPMGRIQSEEMTFVSKPWGYEHWICNNPLYCGKILFIKKGKYLSYHYHKIKDEVLFVQEGFIHIITGETDDAIDHQNNSKKLHWLVHAGDAFHIKPNVPHQILAMQDTTIIEFSTQHFDLDSYRITRDLAG